MNTRKQIIFHALGSVLLFFAAQLHAGSAIDLPAAEALAIERDSVLRARQAQAQALREQAIAEDTLPDPRLRLGVQNLPTDSYELDQEPMTQIVVGIQQVIPRGDTLALKSQRAIKTAEGFTAEVDERRRGLIMQTRMAYLELLYWLHAETRVRDSFRLFRQLVEVTQSQYASGVQQQQDVIRAELELGLLDDRLDEVLARQQATRAVLAKLIGEEAADSVTQRDLPVLQDVPALAQADEHLRQHPLLRSEDTRIASSQYDIELARQEYKPDWMLEFNYGIRDGYNMDGSDRADFVSAMLSVDLPLFTGDRQDRKVAASRLRHQASMDAREERLRLLQQELAETRADWERLGERLQRYRELILPQAHENAQSALHGYQNRRADFAALMRARITELDAGLNFLRLHVNYLKAQAKLLYLLGETS